MPLYEHVFLARQDASTQQVEELTAQVTGVVEKAGGKVTKTENWGVRSLTYRMNKNRKAHFMLMNIEAPAAAISEVERQERLSEDVLRFLTVKVEGDEAPVRKGRPRLEYELHETVRVKEGPFADFSGEIVEINEDQLKVKVLVNIFGRETPVELEFSQVAKL